MVLKRHLLHSTNKLSSLTPSKTLEVFIIIWIIVEQQRCRVLDCKYHLGRCNYHNTRIELTNYTTETIMQFVIHLKILLL